MSLTIYPRTDWHARKSNGTRTRRAPSSITQLFIHWPGAVPKSWQNVNTVTEERATIKGFQNYHIDSNGWTDIGYNHVLVPNWGRPKQVPHIYTARGAQYVPAAQTDHNAGTLAICVLMGPDDPLLESVKERLRSYVRWAEHYAGHELKVMGHRQNPSHPGATECPGPKLLAYVPTLDKV